MEATGSGELFLAKDAMLVHVINLRNDSLTVSGENILAFTVCPGFTASDMVDDYMASRGGQKVLADIPLGRIATAEEVAETVRWLATQAPASATGAVIDVNGASFVR